MAPHESKFRSFHLNGLTLEFHSRRELKIATRFHLQENENFNNYAACDDDDDNNDDDDDV